MNVKEGLPVTKPPAYMVHSLVIKKKKFVKADPGTPFTKPFISS